VDPDGRPHVTPVGVFYDPETQSVVVGSAGDMPASKKFRDAQRRPGKVRLQPTRREPRS
jgi:pyridoxamine 5'-phosphate oxidase family protein